MPIIENQLIMSLAEEIMEHQREVGSLATLEKREYEQVERLPDMSFEALLENKKIMESLVARANIIRGSQELSSYDLLALEQLEYYVRHVMFPVSPMLEDYYYLSFDITPYKTPLFFLWELLGMSDRSTTEAAKRHINLARDYVRFTRQMRDKVFEQARRGIYLFRFAIESTRELISSYGTIPYEDHPLNLRRGHCPASDEQDQLTRKYVEEAGQNLISIVGFLGSADYKERAPEKPGWEQYEKGLEYYAYLKEFHLSFSIDSCELQKLGFKLLSEANEKQAAIRQHLGFQGTHSEFMQSLRGNERFYPTTAEKVGELMNSYRDKVQAELPKYFDKLIETPCHAERLEASLEPSMTFGYFAPSSGPGVPGVYYYNGLDLENKCQINIPSIITHELLPGHHFQECMVSEHCTLHPILRKFGNTCYGDGWAEYSSDLVQEMGIFDDYDHYGRLEGDKFVCMRMIVDTGLNELGWTLEQARQFMTQETFATESMAISESIRYAACIPAQCLPYKYGNIRMKALRERYRNALGDSYDIKKFHSLVLHVGNVPMSMLEAYVEREISKVHYR